MIYKTVEGARAVEERYRELLKSWPVPSVQQVVPTSRGDTFVLTCGAGPPLVLLHGTGANALMWQDDIPAWSRNFRIYVVDLIGEPGLSAPVRPPLDEYPGWLEEVLRGLALDKISLVGASLGAWLALQHATRHPDQVERLAVLCPSGVGRQRVGTTLAALALVPFGRWGRRRAMRLALGPIPQVSGPLGEFTMLVHKSFRTRKQRIPIIPDEALRRLTMPALVIVGGRDGLLDSRQTRRRLDGIATVAFLPEAGHLLPGQTTTILEFLHG